jgi:membrane dipeptidase
MSAMNMSPARGELFGKYEQIGKMTPAEQTDLNRQWRELDKQELMWAADFDAYMKMVLRAIEVGGVDHICFGADWDGGGGVIGMEDITALPRIGARLRREGFSEADIAKVMGGNLLRVMRQVQAAAAPAPASAR